MTCDHSAIASVFNRFSPNNVHTLGVLTVGVKGRCPIEVLHRGVRLIRCYLQCIHASRNLRSALRLRTLTKSGGLRWVLDATALSLWRRANFRTGWSLSVAQGKPRVLGVQSRLFVTGARGRNGFTLK